MLRLGRRTGKVKFNSAGNILPVPDLKNEGRLSPALGHLLGGHLEWGVDETFSKTGATEKSSRCAMEVNL
ncbi:hypothetical protein CDAR_522221 [Caerostris darwini]|uniref:Uncharacterized protein n=1 Tax=Caerostris darwini TaxID=1538125 RepID=A0AAV4SQQ9_9ARAC|nr:hypothetical protein CDAR_522221 [Caerostris darwini]